jgi:hypothetical protein
MGRRKGSRSEPSCHWDPKSKKAVCYGGGSATVGGTDVDWPAALGPKPKNW